MRIGVLIHARDTYFQRGDRWLLRFVLAAARERGHSVQILQGIRSRPELDVLIPHVDLTVRPPEYEDFIGHYRRVLNRGLRDISKRALGGKILQRDDDFQGPVILKSDLNFGGRPELRIIPGRRLRADLMASLRKFPFLRGLTEGLFWRWTPCLSSRDYRVYPSLRYVPSQAFHNPNLVAQPFEPEEEDGLYALRKWTFLGDAETCSRTMARAPIVKASNRIPGLGKHVQVPEELREFRRGVGMDFGKIDFLLRGEKAVVIDVNPTPSISTGGGMRGAARRAPLFAQALEHWMEDSSK